jgi:hypothetical protein
MNVNLKLKDIPFNNTALTRCKQTGTELSLDSDGEFDRSITDEFTKSVTGDSGWVTGLKDARIQKLVREFKAASEKRGRFHNLSDDAAMLTKKTLDSSWTARAYWRGEKAYERELVIAASRRGPEDGMNDDLPYMPQSMEVAFGRSPESADAKVVLAAYYTEYNGESYHGANQTIQCFWSLTEGARTNTILESAGRTRFAK